MNTLTADSIADVLSTYFSLVLTEPMLHHIQNFLLTVKQKLPPAVSVDGRGQFTIFIFCFPQSTLLQNQQYPFAS